MLPHFIDLINRVLARFTAEERVNIGIHTCPGGDRDAVHSADVPYSALLPSLFELNAGYFLMQNKSERDREEVYKLVGEHSREDADGVAQVVHISVINPQNPAGRDPARKCATSWSRPPSTSPRSGSGSNRRLRVLAVQHIDEKPLHGSPDFARDVAFEKITSRVQGTQMAAEKLGIHVPAAV